MLLIIFFELKVLLFEKPTISWFKCAMPGLRRLRFTWQKFLILNLNIGGNNEFIKDKNFK